MISRKATIEEARVMCYSRKEYREEEARMRREQEERRRREAEKARAAEKAKADRDRELVRA